jgi:hypothetical protein
MTLKYLPHEAFWYLFKVITFGSTDPKMHPRLAYTAMEISKTLNGSLIAANLIGGLLRTNFSIQYWCTILELMRETLAKSRSVHGGDPLYVLNKNKPGYNSKTGYNY